MQKEAEIARVFDASKSMFFLENCGDYPEEESIPFPAEGAVFHVCANGFYVLFELEDGSVFADYDVMPE